ncbi:MAG: GNAT family N-acetyltransferase [Kofleriaceae bacterium]
MATEVTVRPWSPADAVAAAALSERHFPPDPPWSPELLRIRLTADIVGGGAQVRVAVRAGQVVGVGAFVIGAPWLYLWPLAADDEAAAGALIDALLALGRRPGLRHARVSLRRSEQGKHAALVARGFAPTMHFVFLARPPVPALPARTVPVIARRGAAIDRVAMHALHERTFADIAGTAPTSLTDFAAQLDGPEAWPEATSAWHDQAGACVGFVVGVRAAGVGVIEAIGVAPAWRGRGLGTHLVADVLATAAGAGLPAVEAVVASSNAASLALHARAGFTERARKELWDLAL